MKPNKENIITEILIELEKGITFTACMELFDMIWSLPPTTFKRYWAEANLRYTAVNQKAQKEISDILVGSAKERLKMAILSKDERMEILTKIAKGDISIKKEVATKFGVEILDVVPDFNDRKAAIAELNKMDGEYAPIRKDITSGGEKLAAPKFEIILDNGEG